MCCCCGCYTVAAPAAASPTPAAAVAATAFVGSYLYCNKGAVLVGVVVALVLFLMKQGRQSYTMSQNGEIKCRKSDQLKWLLRESRTERKSP